MKKILLSIATLVLLTLNVQAANPKYVIQVSTDDAKTQKIALNNAVNLQKHYGGADKVDIEIVAFGPGLSILTTNNKNTSRVESMALNNIRIGLFLTSSLLTLSTPALIILVLSNPEWITLINFISFYWWITVFI
jgi:hypothetical protein